MKCSPPLTNEELQNCLQNGRRIVFSIPFLELESTEERSKRTIPAAFINDLVDPETLAVGVSIEIANAVIEGDVILRHCTFDRVVSFTGCEFTGVLDFSFSTFLHGLTLDGAQTSLPTVLRGASVQGELSVVGAALGLLDMDDIVVHLHLNMSFTTFREYASLKRLMIGKDALFDGSVFLNGADFSAACISGNADFTSARFVHDVPSEPVAEFSFCSVTGDLIFAGAHFGEAAAFHQVQLNRNTDFSGTQFSGASDFTGAKVVGEATFSGALFKGSANFSASRIGGSAFFDSLLGESAIFENDAVFDFCTVTGDASFTGARFIQKADFSRAKFGGNVVFSGAKFKGFTTFNASRIEGDAYFDGVEAEQSDGTKTRQPVVFDDAAEFAFCTINGGSSFVGAHFERKCNFSLADLNRDADFRATRFVGPAIFNSLRIGRHAFFSPDGPGRPVVFEDAAEFTFCTIAGDAIFAGAHFEIGAAYVNAEVGGAAAFTGARFDGPVDFGRAKLSGEADFTGAHFGDRANFSLSQIGRDAYFHSIETEQSDGTKTSQPVVFEDAADFSSAKLGGNAVFSEARFTGPAIFSSSRISGDAYFDVAETEQLDGTKTSQPVVFEDEARFADTNVTGSMFFTSARFAKAADFSLIDVGRDVSFTGARFQARADFSTFRISGHAFFEPDTTGQPVVFEDEAVFDYCTFIGNARFTRTCFRQKADFSAAKLRGNAIFPGVQFKGPADFREAEIAGISTFGVSKGTLDAPEQNSSFASDATFSAVHFHRTADFKGAVFSGDVDFSASRADADVLFQDASFLQATSFRAASFHRVYFTGGNPDAPDSSPRLLREKSPNSPKTDLEQRDQFRGLVDLQDFTYERITVDWRHLLNRLKRFDRQPYTQLEVAIRRTGNDRDADAIYYERCRTEAMRRRSVNQPATWPRAAFDFVIQQTLAGYGVRPKRFLFWTVVVLVIGTLVFGQVDAVTYAEPAEPAFRSDQSVQLDPKDAIKMSLSQLVPVDIPGQDRWRPSDATLWQLEPLKVTFADYAITHRIAGWILVPVGVAIIAGALRRQSPATF